MNGLLFRKSMSNIFITVQNVTINMFIIFKTISEFVASGQVTSRSRKTIENLIKTYFWRCKWDLFSKSLSNKFKTLNNVFINMFLIIKAIFEFDASGKARSRGRKSIVNSIKTYFGRCKWVLFRKTVINKLITVTNVFVKLLSTFVSPQRLEIAALFSRRLCRQVFTNVLHYSRFVCSNRFLDTLANASGASSQNHIYPAINVRNSRFPWGFVAYSLTRIGNFSLSDTENNRRCSSILKPGATFVSP